MKVTMKQFISVQDAGDIDALAAKALAYKSNPLKDKQLAAGKRDRRIIAEHLDADLGVGMEKDGHHALLHHRGQNRHAVMLHFRAFFCFERPALLSEKSPPGTRDYSRKVAKAAALPRSRSMILTAG